MEHTISRPAEWRDIDALIGNTPLINISYILGLPGPLYAKCEFKNPTGSHKVRPYAAMLKAAEKSGKLRPDSEVVDYTTGNGAAAMAWLCSLRGYRCTAVMPDGLPEARYEQTRSYGASVIKADGPGTNVAAARARAEAYVTENPSGRILLNQSDNPENAIAFEQLGLEIYEQLKGKWPPLATFICGFGTGGALTGTCRTLRNDFSTIRTVGVEVDRSAVLWASREGRPASPEFHNIIGFSPGAIAPIMDVSFVNESALVNEEEAAIWTRIIRERTGYWVGTSSGASVAVAARLLKKRPNTAPCLTFLWDVGWKYV
ncbi:MAG: pyridoxal-phosphate dependent enzyme [Patescibacteria group bacterium]|nr:pyridoxal-phosphate dependent enzyme [Patescibacteria group bacterium]